MAQHTKGPWEAADREDYGDFDGDSRVILGDDRRISVVQHSGSEEDEANALLIAAAPDLLEALRVTAGNIRSLGAAGALDLVPKPYREWLSVVEAAIAKAERR